MFTSSTPIIVQIPEILKLIFDHCPRSDKKTLFNLAVTCREFEGPATDVLWFNLDSFSLLVKCLPTSKWKVANIESYDVLVLRRPIIPSDCSRLLHYADKVRRFSIGYSYQEVHRSVFEAIQVVLHGRTLLPNVQHVFWTFQEVDLFSFIPMFMGPNISSFDYAFSSASNTHLSLIPALCEHYPSLKSFEYSFHGGLENSSEQIEDAVEFISDLIYKWNDLRSLTVPNLTYSALLMLAELPYLKNLRIWECKFGGTGTSTKLRGGFPALNLLELEHCDSVSDCISVLTLFDGSPLTNISISLAEIERYASWEKVFHALNRHCSQKTLIELNCWDGERNISDRTFVSIFEEMITYNHIRPLLDFHNLKVLSIALTKGIYISDPTSIIEMANAWRSIETLELGVRNYSRNAKPSKIAISDLMPLAENCHNLKVLGLPMDATSVPDLGRNINLRDRVRGTTLSKLFVADSPIENPDVVAAELYDLFPSLKTVRTIEQEEFGEPDNARQRSWKQVETIINKYSTVVRNRG